MVTVIVSSGLHIPPLIDLYTVTNRFVQSFVGGRESIDDSLKSRLRRVHYLDRLKFPCGIFLVIESNKTGCSDDFSNP